MSKLEIRKKLKNSWVYISWDDKMRQNYKKRIFGPKYIPKLKQNLKWKVVKFQLIHDFRYWISVPFFVHLSKILIPFQGKCLLSSRRKMSNLGRKRFLASALSCHVQIGLCIFLDGNGSRHFSLKLC